MDGRFVEHDFLAWLRESDPRSSRLLVGIGDDCAVYARPVDRPILLALDTVVEGTHAFSREDCPEVLARKVVLSNLSDIAAMAGRPETALLSLKLGRGADASIARRIIDTVRRTCAQYDLLLVGGDTVTGDGPIVLSLAITGHAIAEPVTRSGARIGDVVFATGAFGGSILGRHADFRPRLREAEALVRLGPPTAMADVSDGLLRDLSNIVMRSGCGAVVDTRLIPIHADAIRLSAESGRPPLEHALHDGEDFELIGTMDPASFARLLPDWRESCNITAIGRVVAEGLWLESDAGRERTSPGGYDHGAVSGEKL